MCLLVSCLAFDAIEVAAQNGIVLRQQETHEDKVELKIGDGVTIEIFADLGTVGAAGISVFVTLPKAVFHIVDERHVRLMISEAYFHLGRYSIMDQQDPDNAAAQLRLVNEHFRFENAGQLLDSLSVTMLRLQSSISDGM